MRSTTSASATSVPTRRRTAGTARPKRWKSSRMPQLVLLALAAVAVLMLKHAVADLFLQTSFQHMNKGIYGHPGGLLHAAIHVALTPLVYLVLAPASIALAAGLAVGEFAVHYHI